MSIRTRIITAVLLVVLVANLAYILYFIKQERQSAQGRLEAAIRETDHLLGVVTAGPLYDGNLEQLNTTLDSFFSNPEMLRIELTEYGGDIRLSRLRSPYRTPGREITSRVLIVRGRDELGEISTTYTTALIEQRLAASRNSLLILSGLVLLGLLVVTFLAVRGVTGPVVRLTEAARAIAGGDLERKILTHGASELVSLGQSFIRMRDAIREQMADLAEQNRALRRTQVSIDRAREAVFWIAQDGGFLYVNDAACGDLGYNREELLRLSVFDIEPQLDRESWEARWREAREEGSTAALVTARTRDSREIPFEMTIDHMSFLDEDYLCAYARDITARKLAEETLKVVYSAMAASINGIAIADAAGSITYVNDSLLQIWGFDHESQVVGRPATEFWQTEADASAVIETLRRDGRWVGELKGKKADGTLFDVQVWASAVRGEAGDVTHLMASFLDVTERTKAEAERARLEAQLLQAQKMESVGRLAGGVAHDFNNMLSVILGYVELIQARLSVGDPLAKELEEIEKAATRSRDITRQLLAFSRKQVISPRIVNLNDIVAESQKTLIRLIGEDIEVLYFAGKELWNVECDPAQIDQVLINLAVNARDAMPNGGTLTIETENTRIDDSYAQEHLDCRPGDYVQLTVSDTGCGMDDETLANVFEPFYTTKGIGSGTGLGLATVYGIVKQARGMVNAYSEVGVGTTFKVYLPRATRAAREDRKTVDALPETGTGTVLLVEDDDMVREMVRSMLKQLGYDVLIARTPTTALDHLAAAGHEIILVITDVVMPEMNGTELLKRIRALGPRIPVLYISGYTANVIAHHGVLVEGVHFLQKPFGIRDLALGIRRTLQDTA